jgi:hypothetical protein
MHRKTLQLLTGSIVFSLLIPLSAFAATFTIGQKVTPTKTVNVRQSAAGTLLGTQAAGSVATVVGGPNTALFNGANVIWWKLDFSSGVDGWVGEDNLAASSGTTPPPPPAPASSGTWPSGWNDPIFANVVSRGINSYGMSGVNQDFSIVTTSGEPAVGCSDFTARRFRVQAREGIRLCGDNVLAEDFFLDISGSGADHADGVQAYGENGMSNIVLRRGNIIVRGAANTGVFLADNSSVDLTMEHVRVDGTGVPNGALFFANVPRDKGCNSLRFNDVVVIGGYRFEGLSSCTVYEWTNVRDGNGNPIPNPNPGSTTTPPPPPPAVTPPPPPPASDTTPPVVTVTAPSGTLAAGTTQTSLTVTTNESATCSWSSSAGVAFASMTAFSSTGGTSHSTTLTGLTNGSSYTRYVKCKDTTGNISADSSRSFSVASGTTPPPPPPAVSGTSIFSSQTPVTLNATDGAGINYELGMLFKSSTNGTINAIRFYKSSSETGTHVGHIWNAGGTLLATVTFTGETASGWQQQNLSSPLAISANTNYVVSVNTGNTYYSATTNGLASAITNGSLSTIVGNNGVYGSAGVFPTGSYQASNYFRDVVFASSGVTTPPPPPPATSGTIPLTFNDSMFSGVTNSGSVTLSSGGSLSNKSITVNGPAASVQCNGACTLDHVRVNSAEAVRVGGSGTVSINNSYLEALGSGADHADVIQAYSPGSRGTISVTNSSIVAHNTAATAGLFVADNWTGNINLNNVVFNGGPYGLRVHPDVGGDNIITANNVYFVGPFGYGAILMSDVGGHKNIVTQWNNVRNATIVNGVLVPGSLMSCPVSSCGN